MANLIFGFKNLVNPSSNVSLFDLTSFLFNDSYLKSLSPERYNFYIKFVSGLSNPKILEKFFFRTKQSKNFKQEFNNKIMILSKLIDRLNTNFDDTDRRNIIENITTIIKNKFKYNDENMSKITNLLSNSVKGGANDAEDIIMNYDINKGPEPMKKFIEKVNYVAPDITYGPPLKKVTDLLKKESIPEKPKPEVIKNLKSIYDKYKDTLNPNNLNITMIDRTIFIITTFILRYISLLIIDWALSSNIINSFHHAFYMYFVVYILFFIFITMIINVIVYYPIMELFSNISIINIPNYFYYFYIYTNGSLRLLLHIFILILILFIPYVINMDKINLSFLNNNKNISHDYEKKNKINEAISFFSFIIWILTSIIALKF